VNKEEARERARAEKNKAEKRAAAEGEGSEQMDIGGDVSKKPGLINDPRFKAFFEDPDFEVDEAGRGFTLVNPSLAGKRREALRKSENNNKQQRTKTAVEEGEEEMEGMGDFSSDSDFSSDEKSGSDDSSEGDGELSSANSGRSSD